jgi:hypothetical protein
MAGLMADAASLGEVALGGQHGKRGEDGLLGGGLRQARQGQTAQQSSSQENTPRADPGTI